MSNDNLAGTWTRRGLDKLAAQLAGGESVTIKSIALGDGGGTVPPALESMTALLGEQWRGSVNTVEIDPDSTNSVIVQAVIPYNVGGFFIREWGLYDAEGDLVAYGPHAEFYKPVLDSGSGAELLERIKLPVTSQSQITLVVSSDVLATRDYVIKVFNELAGVVESLRGRQQASWTLKTDITENGELVLPDGITYLPGREAINVLSWDGVVCHINRHFLEVGEKDIPSDRVQLLFSAPKNSEFYIDIAGHSGAPALAGDGSPGEPGSGSASIAVIVKRLSSLEQQISNVAEHAAYVTAPQLNL